MLCKCCSCCVAAIKGASKINGEVCNPPWGAAISISMPNHQVSLLMVALFHKGYLNICCRSFRLQFVSWNRVVGIAAKLPKLSILVFRM